MNKEHVNVVKTKIVETAFKCGTNVILAVVSAPELGDDEQLFTLDNAICNCPANTFTDFLFIVVVGSAIQKTVANLDSIVDHFRSLFEWDLSASKSN